MKKFCFIFSFRNGATIMSFASILLGVALILECVINLTKQDDEKFNTVFIVGTLMGVASIVAGGILAVAIMKAKERYILFYILIKSVLLLIVTIFFGMFVFSYPSLLFLLILTALLWLGVFGLHGFYLEMLEYNTSIQTGIHEIHYTENGAYDSGHKKEFVENTAV